MSGRRRLVVLTPSPEGAASAAAATVAVGAVACGVCCVLRAAVRLAGRGARVGRRGAGGVRPGVLGRAVPRRRHGGRRLVLGFADTRRKEGVRIVLRWP